MPQKLAELVADDNLPAATLAKTHTAKRLRSDGVIIFFSLG